MAISPFATGALGPVQALVAACLLIAQADGEVTPDERGRMIESLGARAPPSGDEGVAFIDDALTAFEALEAGFEARPEEAWAEAELMIRALKGRSAAPDIAAAATAVAIDGGLTAEERSLLLDICDWLDVRPTALVLWPRPSA
ncbi:TerB family tellurite resistance protein [uncultured Caulobacter sp.]|uniref:TerB family tellurite resistance protein n=1 Tax=uncultured Caulobacter sp. TaxID=158749 RepID=UPI00260E820D|nr:TerB family tellurite resistance protein [uncultured Caulobacter sp.]